MCVCVWKRNVYSRDTHFCNLSVCCSIPTLRRIRKSSWHKTLAWQYFKSTTGELVHLSPIVFSRRSTPPERWECRRSISLVLFLYICARTHFPRREFRHWLVLKWMRGADKTKRSRHVIAVWEHCLRCQKQFVPVPRRIYSSLLSHSVYKQYSSANNNSFIFAAVRVNPLIRARHFPNAGILCGSWLRECFGCDAACVLRVSTPHICLS